WRTKNEVLKTGLGPSEASSSLIVTTAVDGAPRVAPVGLLKTTLKVSAPSAYESLMIGTLKVLVAGPAAKLTVPTVVAKSQRPKPAPCLAAQFTLNVSVSFVR